MNKARSLRETFKKRFDLSVTSIVENGKRISLLSIAIPSVCNSIFSNLLGALGTYMLAGYADDAVGATSAALQLINIAIIIMNLSSIGGAILAGIELGRGNKQRVAEITGCAFLMTFFIAISISAILFFFAKPLLIMMNLDRSVLHYGVTYLRIRGGFIFILGMNCCINNFLICHGHMVHSMINGIGSNVLFTFFAYFLLRKNIIPTISGTAAVAVSSMLACFISLLYMIVVFAKVRCPIAISFKITTIKTLLSTAIPGSFGDFSQTISSAITTSFMGIIGIIVLNAKSYLTTIFLYTYIISSGISYGVKILIGRYAGRGDFNSMKMLCRIALIFTVLTNVILSFAFCFFNRNLLEIFTEDENIIRIALPIFYLNIILEAFRAVNQTLSASLNAALDVKTTFIAGVISSWCGSVVLSYVLGVYFALGLIGCWIAFTADEIIRTFIFLWRWKSERWKKKLLKTIEA